METTWDGLPVSKEKPVAVSVVVWRPGGGGREWLLLHRTHAGGPDFEGDWAWTPPAGARLPGEPVDAAARRELLEEVGFAAEPQPTPCGDEDVAVFAAEAPRGVRIALDAEHDRYLWASLDEARSRCLPRRVADQLVCVAGWLDGQQSRSRRNL